MFVCVAVNRKTEEGSFVGSSFILICINGQKRHPAFGEPAKRSLPSARASKKRRRRKPCQTSPTVCCQDHDASSAEQVGSFEGGRGIPLPAIPWVLLAGCNSRTPKFAKTSHGCIPLNAAPPPQDAAQEGWEHRATWGPRRGPIRESPGTFESTW